MLVRWGKVSEVKIGSTWLIPRKTYSVTPLPDVLDEPPVLRDIEVDIAERVWILGADRIVQLEVAEEARLPD